MTDRLDGIAISTPAFPLSIRAFASVNASWTVSCSETRSALREQGLNDMLDKDT